VKDEGVSESPIPGSWILRFRVTPWAVIMSTPSKPNTSDITFIHGEVEGMMWYARVWVEYQQSDHEIRTTKEHETLQVDLEVARGEIIILTSTIKEVKASTKCLRRKNSFYKISSQIFPMEKSLCRSFVICWTMIFNVSR